MVDIDSGEVIEFFDEEIERRQRQIVAQHGYDLQDHSLVLYVKKKKEFIREDFIPAGIKG